MATKLKNIKFGDDLLKGSANTDSGVDYPFGTHDRIVEEVGSSTSALMEYAGCNGWRFHGYADGINDINGSTWSPSYYSDIGGWSLDGYACGINDGNGNTWSPSSYSDIGGWSLNGYADGIVDNLGNTWSPSYGSDGWDLQGYACGINSSSGGTWAPSYDSDIGGWSLNGYADGIGDSEGRLELSASTGWISLDGLYDTDQYTIIEGDLSSAGVLSPRFKALDLGVKYIGVGNSGSESFYELSVDGNGFVKATQVS